MEDNRDDIMIILQVIQRNEKVPQDEFRFEESYSNVFDFEDYTADEIVRIGLLT